MSQLHRNLSNEETAVLSSTTSEDYQPQHPVLVLPNAIPTSSQDHLDDFTEVNPFEREEMEDAEGPFSGIGSIVKGKFAARARKKKAKAKDKAARKTAEVINKLAVKAGKLKQQAKKLIEAAANKYGMDEDSLKEQMSDHLTKFGKDLLDM